MENLPAIGGGGASASPGMGPSLPGAPTRPELSVRSILRVVVTVVASALALVLIYLLRSPLSWLFYALFLSVAVSVPVNRLSRRMRRGSAIGIVYVGVILIPIIIGLILVPPVVRGASDLVTSLPAYVQDLNETIADSDKLQQANENFGLTDKLDSLAASAASSLDDAALALADIGAGVVGSIFSIFTILVMAMFMSARGENWMDTFLATRPEHEAVALRRAFSRMVTAISGYVGGALAQATVAGFAAFIMLEILGVPGPLALALVIALVDLIPMVGATLGAIVVGIVTLFTDFPTATIIWTIFAIVYQQFENYVVQPRIQSKAVQLDPFLIVIAALFGGTLFGVVGALLAIPVAASIQIVIREYLDFRRTHPTPTPATSDAGSSA